MGNVTFGMILPLAMFSFSRSWPEDDAVGSYSERGSFFSSTDCWLFRSIAPAENSKMVLCQKFSFEQVCLDCLCVAAIITIITLKWPGRRSRGSTFKRPRPVSLYTLLTWPWKRWSIKENLALASDDVMIQRKKNKHPTFG